MSDELPSSDQTIVLAGIDEAGYGPTLGPLCVAMSVFELPRATSRTAPDLWELLHKAVCREPGRGGKHDVSGRIAVADSKQLKGSNHAKSVHPLVHLERGVLGFLHAQHEHLPADDAELFALLGTAFPAHDWYAPPATALPCANDAGLLRIAASKLRGEMHASSISARSLRCMVVGEAQFNKIAEDSGGKAATTQHAIGVYLDELWREHAHARADGGVRCGLVCDRLGGRMEYAEMLRSLLARAKHDVTVEIIEESPARSKYVVRCDGASPRAMGVTFLVESEQRHLAVALASMTAKYTRELAMMRFNRWWGAFAARELGVELKPTAGYALDARRWLHDARELVGNERRRELVRIV